MTDPKMAGKAPESPAAGRKAPAEGHRMTCPRCGREVAARTVRGPKVNAGRPIPAIRMPYPHDRPPALVAALGGPKECPYGRKGQR